MAKTSHTAQAHTEQPKRGYTHSAQKPLWPLLVGSALILVALCIFALCYGRYSVAPSQTFRILASHFVPLETTWAPNDYNAIINIRLPRILGAILVGAALALAGASYQSVFQNPLVSPDILGVSHGACLGAATSILLYLSAGWTQVFAFVGGLLAVLVTVSIPRLVRRSSNIVMVLSGVIVGGFMSSLLGLLKYLADPETQLPDIVYWQLGSLAKVDYSMLGYTAPVMLIAAATILAMRWRINLLSLGEDEARTLGVNVRAERGVVIAASTLLTACAVSLSGTIGWVGLIIPHVTRRITGPDNRRLLPCVVLISAAFMVLVDTIARNVSGLEIPLGVLTGLIGAPLFGYILVKQRNVD